MLHAGQKAVGRLEQLAARMGALEAAIEKGTR